MLGWRYVAIATMVVGAVAACHKPRAATPQAAARLYAQAVANDDPKLAYALLSRALRARTPYQTFAARWEDQRAERAAQLEALTKNLAPEASSMSMVRVASIATVPRGIRARPSEHPNRGKPREPSRRALFVKHGPYWYAETPLLSATHYETPEAAVAALGESLAAPEVLALVSVWTADRRIELSQQLDIFSTGLRQALDAGTRANLLGSDRAQFSFYAGDLWFLVALVAQDGQWQIENVYSDTGVYPIP